MSELLRYAAALAALLILTAVSYGLSLLSLGNLGVAAAIAVAGVKVMVVVLVFMELLASSTVSRLAAAITVAFVALLCLGLAADILYR